MGQPLRILLVEDSEDDAELMLRELRRSGYEVTSERVATAEAMANALERDKWDLVMCDYVLPGFGGLEALALFRRKGFDIPFIVVSGHIGEEIAVAAMQAGADDYLMKDRLARLVPAVRQAVQTAETRRAHQRANEALRDSEERFRQLAENIGAVFFMFERPSADSAGFISYVSPAFEKIWGMPCETAINQEDAWLTAIHPEDQPRMQAGLGKLVQGNFNGEFRLLRNDGTIRWIQLRAFPVRNAEGVVYRLAALAEDITQRKIAEERLAANAQQLRDMVQELQAVEEDLRESNEELSQARQKLEKRVQERTADLTVANAQLQRQMNERKRLENELLEIAENERRRIGFDLHDDIGQKLMGVSLLLKATEKKLAQKHSPEVKDTRKVLALVDTVINHTHDLAHCFSSMDLQGDDLCSLIKKLVGSVQQTFPVACRFRTAGPIPTVSGEVTSQLYKIAQESISNAIKHGKAKKIFVSLARQRGKLILRVKNDGVPFPIERGPTRRMGLRIMNYRAQTLGGTFDIRPNSGRAAGALVTCTVPIINGTKPHAKGNGTQSALQHDLKKPDLAPAMASGN